MNKEINKYRNKQIQKQKQKQKQKYKGNITLMSIQLNTCRRRKLDKNILHEMKFMNKITLKGKEELNAATEMLSEDFQKEMLSLRTTCYLKI